MDKKLPKGWVETDFDSIVTRVSNGANLDQKDVYFKGSYPISRIETIAQETIDLERVKYVEVNEDILERYCLQFGDILFSHINSDKHLGKTAYFNIVTPVIHGVNLLLIRCNDLYYSKLLHYLFKYYRLEGKFMDVAQRSVNQSSINQKRLRKFSIPLPPLPEQQRIVAKLDTLFGQLDRVKISMERIPKLLKDFRQKVLTQAVTGKLTEEFREGKELEEWKNVRLESVCISITDGDHQAPPQVIEGIPFLVISNVSKGFIDLEHVTRFVPKSYYESLKASRIPKKGDVLYTVTGSFGIPLMVKFDKEFCFQRHIAILKPNVSMIYSSFLQMLLESTKIFEQASEVATGTAQLTVPLNGLRNFNADIPPLEEQREIVHRVESLFARADQIEASYQNLKTKVLQLPQALLAKAFRGELVEQLPTDGDARELLMQIKKARAALEKPKEIGKYAESEQERLAAELKGRHRKK